MKLPQASASEVVAALEQLGWQVARRGNHIVMKHAERRKAVSIPDHREIKRGTLRSILRVADVSVEEFVEAMK